MHSFDCRFEDFEVWPDGAVPFCPILPISGTSWAVIQMTSLITALFCCRSRSAEFQQTWHTFPCGAFSAASPRSRSAEFQQTWNTHPCRSVLCGLSPFQVCIVSTDLEHSPSPEASLWPVAVPGLRSFSRLGTHSPAEHSLRPLLVPGLHRFDRLGTLTPAGAFSAASFRSRSALFRQTWHTHPRQRLLHSLPPFQVCCRFST